VRNDSGRRQAWLKNVKGGNVKALTLKEPAFQEKSAKKIIPERKQARAASVAVGWPARCGSDWGLLSTMPQALRRFFVRVKHPDTD